MPDRDRHDPEERARRPPDRRASCGDRRGVLRGRWAGRAPDARAWDGALQARGAAQAGADGEPTDPSGRGVCARFPRAGHARAARLVLRGPGRTEPRGRWSRSSSRRATREALPVALPIVRWMPLLVAEGPVFPRCYMERVDHRLAASSFTYSRSPA